MRWTSAIAGLGALLALASASHAADDPRKAPMRFAWRSEGSASWISAQGRLVDDTVETFEDFVRERDVKGVTVAFDSPGGSVTQAIALGRRLRSLGVATTVGTTIESDGHAMIAPDAACESMCAFLLLAGRIRYVPPQAHVRVHQIWMGDRADSPREASYSADDLMIVQRDVGRLAKYVFDMGGSGDLISVALAVPPWDDLHELTEDEIALSALSTVASFDEMMDKAPVMVPGSRDKTPALVAKIQDRFPSGEAAGGRNSEDVTLAAAGREEDRDAKPEKARTAEAVTPDRTEE